MKNYLFPHGFRRIGWTMIAISIVWAVLYIADSEEKESPFPLVGSAFALVEYTFDVQWFVTVSTDWFITFFVTLISVGLLFVGFSRERDEDECIQRIRYQALAWSTFINTGLVILTTLLVYGALYVYMMYIYAFSLLILFVARYFYLMHKFRCSHEE